MLMRSLLFAGRSLTMQIFRSNTIRVTPGFCLLMSIYLLILPLQWVLGWLSAVFMHEFCHVLALLLCRVKVQAITHDVSGAVIKTAAMPRLHEAICALAGPIGGALLVPLGRWVPYAAICAFLLSVYNLLPVYPLDGGRAFLCIVESCCPSHAKRISLITERITIGITLIASAVLTFHLGFGPVPAAAALLLAAKNRLVKYPCKQRKQIVQ